jgi:hypothetical protein
MDDQTIIRCVLILSIAAVARVLRRHLFPLSNAGVADAYDEDEEEEE